MKKIIILLIIYMFISLGNLYLYDIDIFTKQLVWYLIGFGLIFISFKFKFKSIKLVFLIYIILNVFLLYLLLFGSSVNGSRAWINIMGLSFQPSEFMKSILIILLSYVSVSNYKFNFKCILLVLIPSILTFLEPDTGNVIFYLIILFSVIGIRFKSIIKLLLIGLLIAVPLYIFNSYSLFYRLDRFIYFLDNYQLRMALTGISNSGLIGINNLISVPEVSTDFVFTLIIMNYGFIGFIFYLTINIIFNYNLIKLYYSSYGVIKEVIRVFLIVKLFQEGIHIFYNIGIIPITGITLPFISYGGSSLLSYFLIIIYILDNYKDSR